MSQCHTLEIMALHNIKEHLMLRERAISKHFDQLSVTSQKRLKNMECDLMNLEGYTKYLEGWIETCGSIAASRAELTRPEVEPREDATTIRSEEQIMDPDVVDGLSSMSIIDSPTSSIVSTPLAYIVRPTFGDQKQLLRFSTKKMEGSKPTPPSHCTFRSIFELELRGRSHLVNLFIRKDSDDKFCFIPCFPPFSALDDKEPFNGFAEIILKVLDHSGLVTLAKNYIVNMGRENCCQGHSSRGRKCECSLRHGDPFLQPEEVNLFQKCILVKRKKPYFTLQFNARVIIRILPTNHKYPVDIDADNQAVANEIDSGYLNGDNSSSVLTNPVTFVPVEDVEEEIMAGLSSQGKTAYGDWVQFHHLRDWSKNVRVNLELLHFAHFHSLHELASNVVEILNNIPYEGCSVEENLEIVTAGDLFGHVSLLQRTVDHLVGRFS